MGLAYKATLCRCRVQSACSTGRRVALSLAQLVRPHELFEETEQPPVGSQIINDRVLKCVAPMEHTDGPSHVVGNVCREAH